MSTPVIPAPESTEQKVLTVFEKILLGVLAAAPTTVPILIHSQHGLLLANAGENLLASVLQQFATNK